MRKLTLFITSLFLGIGMAWAQTVPSGSLVTFTNVQQDGTEYVLHIDDSGVLAVGEAGKAASEYGDAALFRAVGNDNGSYSFFNEAKDLYMIWEGSTKNPGYNSNKGVLDTYNSTYCDWTLGDGSASKSGTYYLNSKRNDGTTDGTLIILSNGVFDAFSKNVAWTGTYSNLFRIDFVEEDVTVELTDTESGITFGGTYRGYRNITEPTLGWGCQLSNQVWNGNTLTADIQLPFAINEETMIAIHEPELKHRLYVDGENIRVDKTPFEYSNINDWIWKIHPVMTGNVVTFTIEHVATGKYAKAGDTNQHYVEGTVTLVEKESCNTFEIANYGSYPSFKVCEKNSYLSINTDRDESVALGLYGNAHNGTRIHFAPVPVATIDGVEYTTFADAVAAAQSGDVITLLAYCDETVSINKSNVAFTIDGAQQTYAGKVQINIGQNVTIKNVNFVHSGDAAHDFIANVGSPTGKNYNTTLLVENCSFTGNGKENVVAVRTIHPTSVTIEDCTATGLHSFLQNTGGQVVTIDGVTLTDSKGGLAIGSPNGAVSVKNCNLATATYGVRLDANNANAPGATLENNKVTAYIPVSVRKAEAPAYNLTFNGDASEYTATNGDDVWCAVCKDEYEEGVALNNPTGKINVTLNDANLDATGVYGEYVPAAKIGDTEYDTLEEAFKAATAGCTIDILSDVTVDYAWDARYTGGKFTVPVTINGNSKTIKFTASVEDKNYQAPFRFEADATVKNLTIDMSEATDSRFRAISSKGNLTVDGCKFIGKDETLNCRAIIFGEGAGANVGNLAISITNCEFINWRRGITDNENGQDVKTVTVTGNTLRAAAVYVSAKETVTFTGNTVEGAYVNIKSYTADNKLQVTATGNTLEENTDTAYNVINAGGKVEAEGFNIVAKGRDFSGYTGENRIWGETWGNARESFVIKVLDANGNVMGTTSLNNIDGIINGDVLVTWNLLFDAASNDDEYWTMEWTTAPSISNMPAKVALWVDGVEVSGGDVVLNAPDDLNKIVAAATDAEGKILSCHTSLADAVATNATNIALLRETDEVVELPFGVTLDKNGFIADNVTETLPVAKIGDDAFFGTLQAALDAATDGQTVTLLTGITLTDADMVKIEGKYNVMMNVSGKDITLDLNEKTINIDYNGGQYLYAAVFVADGAGLAVTGNGKIDIAENGINVAYMFWKRGTTGHLTIENGTFHMDDSGDSMVYTNGSEIVTVNGGTFTLDAVATRENGFPCVFSAYGQNTANIIVNGGTYNYDVNHQYWAHEVNVPETLALKDNGDGTWTVVPAVAYAVEKSSNYDRHVGYTTLEEAIAAVEAGDIVIGLVADVTFDYNARDAYGTAENTSMTINGNGNTLTLNQKNSDWASIGLANAEAKLVLNNMTIEKTGYGDTSGAWNTHAIIFSCPVEMTGVTINNGIAVQAGAALADVTINEANGYYGLWVNGNGQTVTVNGGAINATNGGRGIKVADQYIDEPAQVTLNVEGTTFNTAKKAAVLVSSTAGAKITANDVDITNVAEDNTNFVWVDEDWATYYNSVEVYGEAAKGQENEAAFPVIVKDGDKVVAYFKNLDDLFDNVSAYAKVSNVTVELTGNVVATKNVKTNSLKTYNFVTNVAEGVTMELQYADGWDYFRKVNIGENVTVKCKYLVFSTETTIAGTVDAYYPYINGGKVTVAETGTLKYEGGDALQVKGDGAVLTVNGTVIAPTINVWVGNAQLVVSGANAKVESNWIDIWDGTPSVAINDGATIETNKIKVSRGGEITVTDANLIAAESIEVGHNGDSAGKLTESGNSTITGEIKMTATSSTVASDGGLNVTTNIADHKVIFENGEYKVVPKEYVAQVGETKYESLHEAMVAAKAGETVLLISDVDLAGIEWEPVSFKGTFDGQNFTISNLNINKPGVSNTGFITSLNGTFKNVTFTNPTVIGGECTAVVAGRAGGYASLAENITINGTIKVETTHSGYARAAAIVGGWAYGNYKNITVDGGDKTVSYIKHTGGGDGRYVAGIVGHADDVDSYENCVVKNITISGGWLCGGIAGPGPSDGLATGCAVENINVNADYSGGMFGWYYGDGTIENSTIADVTFTDGSTNNGPIGGYSNNPDANVNNVTITNVKNADGAPLLSDAVAIDGKGGYASLAAALEAAEANDVITFLTDINESVTISKDVTIDGGDNDYTGTMTINTSLNVAVQNVNFVKGCITEAKGTHGYLTVKDCDFDGVDKSIGYAISVRGGDKVTIENSTAKNYNYGMLYVPSSVATINVKDVTVEDVTAAFNISYSGNGTFENVTLNNVTYGLHVQNYGARTFTLTNWDVTGSEYPIYVQEKGTAKVTFAFEGTNEMGVEQLSSSQYAIYKNASMVGTTVYGDLNDAAAAAAANGTVTLLGNMAIESDLNNAAKGLVNIAADAQVTIDLNGKTIDVTDKSAGNFIVFYNYGVLTIKNGTVNLVAENNREWNAQSTIILNRGGNLTVESGTYTHKGGTDMAFALDNSGNSFGDASMTIVDGTVESAYIAIRNRMADTALNGDPGNGTVELNVQGGYIKGVKRGIWGQITNASSEFLGSLTVTDGTIEGAVAIQMAEDSHENITVAISDAAVIKGELAGDAVDYNVTGGTFYNEVAEGYLAWGYQLVGDAAPYTVEYTGKVNELTLVDGEFTEFVNEQEVTVGTLTYERASIPTTWTPFYVPFEVPVSQLAEQGFEVAYINGVRRNDTDNDGELDEFEMEVIYIHGGDNCDGSNKTLKANYPYFIRTKGNERKDLSIVLENAKLYATTNATFDCTTFTEKFEITGNASQVSINSTDDVLVYGVGGGEWTKITIAQDLKPFRFYMTVTNRGDDSAPVVDAPAAMSIAVRGEEREDGSTFIYDVEMSDKQTVDYIYDLQGRRVLEPQKGGLYIVNGKKVVF